MRDVPNHLEGTGIAAGTTLTDVQEIQEKVRWGYRFLNVGSIVSYGGISLKDHLAVLRNNPTGQ